MEQLGGGVNVELHCHSLGPKSSLPISGVRGVRSVLGNLGSQRFHGDLMALIVCNDLPPPPKSAGTSI